MKHWFIFYEGALLVEKDDEGKHSVPQSENCPVMISENDSSHNIEPYPDGTEVVAVFLGKKEVMPSLSSRQEFVNLRETYYLLDSETYRKAGKCEEIMYWDSQTRYCGVCGTAMSWHTDISKKCPHCGKEVWPLLATAIIVLIHKGDEVLLVRGRNFRRHFYGLVAGFVETGETLEEAVRREVKEETGLTIDNIRYFDSQPWPFPCGLMVGFEADYTGGEIHIQEEELHCAQWFKKDNLPTLPEKLSIARRLIDHWVNEE